MLKDLNYRCNQPFSVINVQPVPSSLNKSPKREEEEFAIINGLYESVRSQIGGHTCIKVSLTIRKGTINLIWTGQDKLVFRSWWWNSIDFFCLEPEWKILSTMDCYFLHPKPCLFTVQTKMYHDNQGVYQKVTIVTFITNKT